MNFSNGAQYFAHFLKESGVTHLFFMPAIGMNSLAAMEDLPIKRVMTHGEKSAAYMADGYARASGRPGVCLAQQIGASNLSAGLRDAFMAGTPLIAISGGPSSAGRYRGAYQEVEDFSQFDAVTKLNAVVETPQRLPDMLRQAWRTATSGAPGPVHLRWPGAHGEVPEGHADLNFLVEPAYRKLPAFRPVADQASIEKVLALLSQAQRPIIVAGGGVIQSGAQTELLQLAQVLDIPIATSMNAKAALPDSDPLSVGVLGTYSRECANRAVFEADLVFFIGSRTGGQVSTLWTIPAVGTPVIQLDIDPLILGRNYPNSASLCGDAKATLLVMLTFLKARKNKAWTDHTRSLVHQWRQWAFAFQNANDQPMRPERVCEEISKALPADAVVVSDTGHSGMWSAAMIRLEHSTQQFLRCAGSLGWALPAAIGAKCAVGNRPVLCWAGDGAVYYHLAELETAARYGINLVVVVNNNNALNQEIPLFDIAYGGKMRGDSDDLWRHNLVNFAQVAENLGCIGYRVETPEQLQVALQKAFLQKRPVVIDVVTDVKAMAAKAWRPAGVAHRAH